MSVLLITRLLRGVGRWARKPVNHTSLVAVVTPTDCPKSVRNCCFIELFCGVVCVTTLPLRHICWYRRFCHRTGSDLLLFVSQKNSMELLEHLKFPTFNHVTSIKSFDFSTLYTTIPHQKLKDRLTSIIRNAFIFIKTVK